MGEWIALDPPEIDLLGEEEGEVRYASPFDAPEQVRTRFEEGEGRFVLEFAYAGLEKPSHESVYGAFRFHLGGLTRRVHRVEIDGLRLRDSARALGLGPYEAVADAFAWLSGRRPDSQDPRPPRPANYEAALRAVEKHRERLLGTLLL